MDFEHLSEAEEQAEMASGGQSGGSAENGGASAVEQSDWRTRWSAAEWEAWNHSRWWSWPSTRHGSYWNQSYWAETEAEAADRPLPASSGVDVERASARNETSTDPWRAYSAGQSGWDRPWDHWRGDTMWTQSSTTRGDFSDPPQWGGWQNFRLWKKAIGRWDAHTDIPRWRRAEKLLKSFDWELQGKFESIPDDQLTGPDYLNVVFGVLNVIAGEKENTDKRRSVRAAIYEGSRRSDETLAQYAHRRESQFTQAHQYLPIPDELKSFMLEEQAGLSKQGIQNLRVLTGGRGEYREVLKALRLMDIDEEPLSKKNNKDSYFLAEQAEASAEEGGSEEDDADLILQAVEEQDLEEEAALSFLTEWPKKRRSWAENKQLKAARKKDRRHFDDKEGRHSRPFNHRKLSVAELKKITRCGNCLEKGHWHEECKNPYKPRSSKTDGEKPKSHYNAFAYVGTAGSSSEAALSFLSFAEEKSSWSFLSVPPGHAVVDPGASQDLIGLPAYHRLCDRLKSVGLKPVKLKEKPGPAAGIGGKSEPLFQVLSPCTLAGFPGVIKLTVLQEDVPQLLSIGLLEHARAVIDTDVNRVTFKAFGKSAPMIRVPESGHRLLDIADWDGSEFPIPKEVCEEFGVRAVDFRFQLEAGEDYVSCGRSSSVLFEQHRSTGSFYVVSEVFESLTDIFHQQYSHVHKHAIGDHFVFQLSLGKDLDVFMQLGQAFNEGLASSIDHISSSFSKKGLRSSWLVVSDVAVRFEYGVCPLEDQNHSILEDKLVCSFICTSEETNLDEFFREAELFCKLSSQVSRVLEKVSRELKNESDTHDHVANTSAPADNLLCEFGVNSINPESHPDSSHERFLARHLPDGQAPIGGGARGCRVQVVQFGPSSSQDTSSAIQSEDASRQARSHVVAGRDGGAQQGQGQREIQSGELDQWMRAPLGAESARSESIRQVGQVPGLPSEVGVSSLLKGQSSNLQEPLHQEQDRSGACCQGHGRSEVQAEGTEDGSQPARRFEQGIGASAGEADGLLGIRNCRGIAAPDGQHGAAAAIHARGSEYDEASGEHGGCRGFELECGYDAATSDANRSSGELPSGSTSCDSLRVRRGDESQQGLGSAAVRALGSLVESKQVSHCTDGWLISELSPHLHERVSSRVDSDSFFLWQPEEGSSTYLVWKDINLVGDLISSDFQDDHEFQLRRQHKRELSCSLNALLGDKSEVKNSEYCGGDAKTPRSSQEDGEDVRTSRKIQEAQEAFCPTLEHRSPTVHPQSPSNPNQNYLGKVRREIRDLSQVLGGHVSPSWLPSWFGSRKSHGSLKVCEVFSPKRLGHLAEKYNCTTTNPASFDLSEGWDCFNAMDRANMWKTLREQEPDVVVLSPDCKAFSVLMESNWSRMSDKEKNRVQTEGLAMLHLCVQIAEFQLAHGRYFVFEHPGGASSWATHAVGWLLQQPGVVRFLFDQCSVGLSVKEGTLSRKVTGIATNHLGVASVLSSCQCSGDHNHLHLQNGYPHHARVYPKEMLNKIWKGLTGSFNFAEGVNASGEVVEESESEQEIEEEAVLARAQPITILEKDKVRHMHLNMGHLPKEQMILILKAAGAKTSVLQHVRDEFQCEQCHRRQHPEIRRRAAFPRTFSFNRIVALDYFFISWEGKTLAYLNCVCHGSNFQQVARLVSHESGTPNSAETWKLFSDLWIRPFGLPEVLLTDGGNEFRQDFERKAELTGLMHIVTDAQSPWQNGRVERHGGWVKSKLENEINTGPSVVGTLNELDLLVTSLVSHKNRWFHRGGYSPCQLVFGVNPRVPSELLSDDPLTTAGLSEVQADDFEVDTPGLEFNRAFEIRQRARKLCMESSAKEKVRLSSVGPIHKQQTWNPGQWVFIWRRFPGSGQGHVTRARWTGPGLVVQQSGHTVWVSLRSRLLKCNSDQLRSATHDESIGAELSRSGDIQELLKQTSGHRAGAVDVSKEGPPDELVSTYRLQDRPEVLLPSEASPTPLAPIPEGRPVEQPQAMPLIRSVIADPSQEGEVDQPESNIRRASRQTLEEPQMEPVPSTPSSTASTRKRLKQSEPRGVVRKRVDELEQEKRERETVRILRRLNREDKQAARRENKSLPSTPRTPGSCPGTPGLPSDYPWQPGPTHPPQEEARVEDTVQVRGPEEATGSSNQFTFFQHLTDELGGNLDSLMEENSADAINLSFATIQPDLKNKRLVSKPWKAKNGEFSLTGASPDDLKGFETSDLKEWSTILEMQAVKVWEGNDAERIKKEHGDRVIDSRMIRRKKPMPGVGNWKYKSRWCVLGHHDPDSHLLATFAPMPTSEAISMFFQLSLNLNLRVSFTDITSAFCQSDPLDRDGGPLYVLPCGGLPNVSKGSVIELIAPVYGLDDAPIRWHHTVLKFFQGLGFERTLLESCWLVLRSHGHVVAMVLIEVDDINLACNAEYEPKIKEAMKQRFKFGKWEESEADYAGRHVRVESNRVIFDQEKYILEKLHPYKLPKGMLGEKKQLLSNEIFEAHRSLLYKVNWVAHQTRPEASGVVSILASRLKQATVHDLWCLNKVVAYLRNTAQQTLILNKFDNQKMLFITASDAGGVDGSSPLEQPLPEDTTQGAWVIMAADQLPSASKRIRISVLSWRSSKLKRRVSSTLAGEALSFSQALGEVEWLQVMFRDVIYNDVSRKDWRDTLCPFISLLREDCELNQGRQPQCGITDAKSLYDSLLKKSPASRQDRRTSIELAIICEAVSQTGSTVRWTPHPRMIADTLTKDDIGRSNGALEELLRSGLLTLWEEDVELRRRQEEPSSKGRSKKASEAMRSSSSYLMKKFTSTESLWCCSVISPPVCQVEDV